MQRTGLNELVIGIDLGTSGVRVLACDRHGRIWTPASNPLHVSGDERRSKQDPADW